MAHSAIGMSAVTDQSAKMELMQKKIDLMEVALAAQQAPGGKRKRGQHAAQEKPRIQVNHNLTPFSARPFCWTHGPCKHAGKLCKGHPLDARQQTATWRHQAGSKWTELFKSKGWSLVSPWGSGMEKYLHDVVCINNIERNFVAADIVNNINYILKSLCPSPIHLSYITIIITKTRLPLIFLITLPKRWVCLQGGPLRMEKPLNMPQSQLQCYQTQIQGRRATTLD